jgi:hypothetical protein
MSNHEFTIPFDATRHAMHIFYFGGEVLFCTRPATGKIADTFDRCTICFVVDFIADITFGKRRFHFE